MKRQSKGLGALTGVIAALTLGGACGNSFGSDSDCKVSRTCAPAGGSSSDAGASGTDQHGGADHAAGQGTVGGTGGESPGGESPGGAAAGGGSPEGCSNDAECSNLDPVDGEEVCEQGACGAGNPPPTIVAVTPNDAAVAVEPDATVVIEFSEPLDPETVTAETIQVLDGTTIVPGELAYADNKVTFTPTEPLALLAPYTVSVTTDVTDAAGAALTSAFASEFSIRDGAWKTIDVIQDRVNFLTDVLPMTSSGSVLLAWGGSFESYCPVSARWFLRGAAASAIKTFPIAGQTECNGVSAGGNAAGVAAVVWNEPDAKNGSDIQQYREGAWQATPTLVSKNFSAYHFGVAVAPSGVVTFFEHSTDTKAWVTDASGKWPASGVVLSQYRDQSRMSYAFDADGNGLVLWRATDPAGTKLERIVVSRLTAATGKWASATDLPGSVTATSPAEHQRGVPAVAFDSNGDAMALWVNASSGSKLMASRYQQATGWAKPEVISGLLAVDTLTEAPGLAFDGKAFVAAWTALDGGKYYAHTARYDLETGWDSYKRQQDAADATSARRMPRLGRDGRGNLLLVFAIGASPTFSFAYQRYTGGAWGSVNPVPGSTVADQYFESDQPAPMAMNSNGFAALAWTQFNTERYTTGIRLASFY